MARLVNFSRVRIRGFSVGLDLTNVLIDADKITHVEEYWSAQSSGRLKFKDGTKPSIVYVGLIGGGFVLVSGSREDGPYYVRNKWIKALNSVEGSIT